MSDCHVDKTEDTDVTFDANQELTGAAEENPGFLRNERPFGEFYPLVSLQELLEWEPNQNYTYR